MAELEGVVSLLPEEKLEITKSGHGGGGQSEGEEGQHGRWCTLVTSARRRLRREDQEFTAIWAV